MSCSKSEKFDKSINVSFRLREILCNISQGNHDEAVCKENCQQNGERFKHKYVCQYNPKNLTIQSKSNMIKGLLRIEAADTSSPRQSFWDKSSLEAQEIVKFDLLTAEFNAMEIEVKEGKRAAEDLEQLRIEIDEM